MITVQPIGQEEFEKLKKFLLQFFSEKVKITLEFGVPQKNELYIENQYFINGLPADPPYLIERNIFDSFHNDTISHMRWVIKKIE